MAEHICLTFQLAIYFSAYRNAAANLDIRIWLGALS